MRKNGRGLPLEGGGVMLPSSIVEIRLLSFVLPQNMQLLLALAYQASVRLMN
jgi:hypothetical protein